MADRTVSVTLKAIVTPFQQGMARAEDATRRVIGSVNQLGHTSAEAAQKMQPLGTALLGIGVSMSALGGLSLKAAIDYESAFAGVRKTTEATEAQFAELSEGIRAMSRTMPAGASEIAAVAEAAGQLGVKREAILSFSETMIMLGETTNLTANDAATAMARIANIMQIPQGDIERLGATLVELGNNGASTESEILDMATRIASAGRQIGLSGSDVLAFANALSSVGIESEAGGTAISRVMIELQNAVMDGGESLDSFAKVAGMSASEFKEAFADAPAEAIVTFVEGLRRLGDEGGNVNKVLEDLGLADIRVANALRAAAGAGDLVRESLRDGAKAFGDGTALTEEYRKRVETTSAQLKILRNNIVDLGITFGTALLPAIKAIAGVLGDLVAGFRGLPEPVQMAAAGAAVLLGGITLLGGGFLFLLPRIVATQVAMATLAAETPLLAAGLRGVLLAAGGIGAVLAIASAAVLVFGHNSADSTQDAKDFAAALEAQAQGAENAVKALVAKKIVDQDLDKLAKDLGISTQVVARAILGDAAAIDQLRDAAGAWNEMSVGGTAADRRRADAATELLGAVTTLNGEYTTEADAALRTATAQTELGAATEETTGATIEATEATETFSEKLDALYSKTYGIQEATDAFTGDLAEFADTVMAAKEAGDAHAASLAEGTVQGLKNREMVRGLIQGALDVAAAMEEAGKSPDAIAEAMGAYRSSILSVLDDLGVSAAEAEGFVDLLLHIDGINVQPTVNIDTGPARAELDELLLKLNDVSGASEYLGPIIATILGGNPTPAAAPAVRDALAGSGPQTTSVRERNTDTRDTSVEKYLRSLHEAEQEAKRTTEAIKGYLDALYRHQQEIEDNQYRFDAISKDRYLEVLRERLKGLEAYSSEWARVMDMIKQVSGDALDEEIAAIERYEAGRAFQRAWDEGIFQRVISGERMAATPTTSSTTVTNSRSLELNLALATASPERVTADTMRAAVAAAGL